MSGVTIKRVDDCESPNAGGFVMVGKSLGISGFGVNFEQFPANMTEGYPLHDHAEDGQEELYVVIEGEVILSAEGEDHRLVPGTFALVAAGTQRRLTTGDVPAKMLAVGGTPGRAYRGRGVSEPDTVSAG